MSREPPIPAGSFFLADKIFSAEGVELVLLGGKWQPNPHLRIGKVTLK